MQSNDAPGEGPTTPQQIVIEGVTYDVARYAAKHPGGEILLKYLGRDATAAFAAFHVASVRKKLAGLKAKAPLVLPESELSSDAERDFAALHARARDEGLFASRPGFFIQQGLFVTALIAASVGLVAGFGGAAWSWVTGALLLGLAWQQAGWLAHDYLHNSVYPEREKGALAGLLIGSFYIGFSADWWKVKHNVHHALPNVLGDDTDIDTLPFLAFSEHELEKANALTRWLVRLQPLTIVPVLSMARINWCVQSLLWALRAPNVPNRGREIAAIVAHHLAVIGVMALLPDWGARLGFYLIAQLSAGLMIGSVFLVGHNARPMLRRDEAPGFYTLQCATTQNISPMPGMRWFFGGLDRQTEHHLFPMMPRHQHDRVVEGVKALCARHQVTYVDRGFVAGLVDVWRVLWRVSLAAWRRKDIAPPATPAAVAG